MTTDRTGIQRLWQCFELFRNLHKEMPLQMASLFVAVAANERLTMAEAADRLGISQSACSRLTATLSGRYKDTQGNLRDGLGLLIATEDPIERRRKIITLTSQGKRLASQLGAIIAV